MSIVAIVGRPNVGKSTLFNRLTETRRAIVSEESGTTRDRQYGKVEWGKKEFSLIDTGGLVAGSDDVFEEEINRQVNLAIKEADLILFMVDVQQGVTHLDMEVANILRNCKKPVMLIANKTDNNDLQYDAPEFYKLGIGDPMCISSMSGFGTGDLLDEIIKKLPEDFEPEIDTNIPRVTRTVSRLCSLMMTYRTTRHCASSTTALPFSRSRARFSRQTSCLRLPCS